jgi:UDP-GlcNAc:undecaprenyl-phosphate GlcNAc-1-phosphate transferase
MYSLIFLTLSSLLLALAFTPLCKKLAWRFGIVDHPDQKRKLHGEAIARLGGVAIFASILCAYALLLVVRFSSGHIIMEDLPLVLHILPALLIVFLLGLIDDIVSLSPLVKLAVEIVAAVVAWCGGIHVSSVEGHPFSVALSFAVTIVWIVGCTNAINLIDGLDGLAAGISLFAAVTMLVAALIGHNYPMALVAVPLVGALLGFLRYNFNPASIFLGDCGSLSLGFILSCCGIVWSEKSTTIVGLATPLLVFAIPLLDAGMSIFRRFLNNKHIFGADSEHIHHKLLSKGLTPRRVVLLLYAICALSAGISLVLTANHDRYRGLVIILVCICCWIGLQRLGYREFGVMGRALLGGGFRNFLGAQLAVEAFEHEMRRDMSLEQSSELLCQKYPQFGFSGIAVRLNDLQHIRGTEEGWRAHIDFGGRGCIDLWRASGSSSHGPAAALFIDCVARSIDHKLQTNVLMPASSYVDTHQTANLYSGEGAGGFASTFADLPTE